MPAVIQQVHSEAQGHSNNLQGGANAVSPQPHLKKQGSRLEVQDPGKSFKKFLGLGGIWA